LSVFALALVLIAAVVHATWNLLTKRAVADAPFLWVAYVVGAVVYAPLAIAIIASSAPVHPIALAFIGVAVVLQTLYFATLTAAYRAGDLSLVYPIARASGPLLATVGAIALFGERPTPIALAGALAILGGAIALTGDPRALRASGAGRAVGFALVTGVVIATYTLWDATAVRLLIPPLVYDWATVTGQALVATPVALARRERVREVWSRQRGAAIAVGILSRLSYILVLTALVVSPVAYVAPAREIGILIGAILGARFLAEGHTRRRIAAASAMVFGVIALAIG
jgi:drug/metabolite transporter (DMT)-like permease